MTSGERDLRRAVADELRLAESSRIDDAMREPIADWQFDPTEAQRYEVQLGDLLKAVEVAEGSRREPPPTHDGFDRKKDQS